MTATTVHQRRPVLPLISMLVAGGAVAISVVAVATDDVGSRPTTPIVTPDDGQSPARATPAPEPEPARSGTAPAGDCLIRATVVRC